MLDVFGEELLKSTLIVHVFIVETTMKLMNLHSIMLNLSALAEKILRVILFLPAKRVIKGKVVVIGYDGCERHLDIDLNENN